MSGPDGHRTAYYPPGWTFYPDRGFLEDHGLPPMPPVTLARPWPVGRPLPVDLSELPDGFVIHERTEDYVLSTPPLPIEVGSDESWSDARSDDDSTPDATWQG